MQATGTDGKTAESETSPSPAAGNNSGEVGAGRSESVSSSSTETGSCSASIGEDEERKESTLRLANDGNWQTKNPIGKDGVNERAMGFEAIAKP
jgi:hypothetical protein